MGRVLGSPCSSVFIWARVGRAADRRRAAAMRMAMFLVLIPGLFWVSVKIRVVCAVLQAGCGLSLVILRVSFMKPSGVVIRSETSASLSPLLNREMRRSTSTSSRAHLDHWRRARGAHCPVAGQFWVVSVLLQDDFRGFVRLKRAQSSDGGVVLQV